MNDFIKLTQYNMNAWVHALHASLNMVFSNL